MSGSIPSAALLPGMVPDEALPELWRQSLAIYYDTQALAPAAAPPAIRQYHLGQMLLIDTRFGPQRFSRDAAWLARHGDVDHCTVQFFVSGRNRVVNGGNDFVQHPDNITMVNLGREVQAESTEADTLTLILPRELLQGELPQLLDRCGALFEDHSASARVFANHMLSLRQTLDRAAAAEADAIAQGTLALLDALTRHRDIAATPAKGTTLTTICRHIDAHLSDPALDAESLCRQFRCSRATLYRLFQPLGGVREHIQRRRLMACFRAISAPARAHRRIFDIALDYGFSSPSHFSSLFRAHFGMTPREARERGGNRPALPALAKGGTAETAVQAMWTWARGLAGS
ncbi:MAG: helix-turn-helix domain-containing protein [Ferrovibrio sp.]|uniref:helix-turn-helix domain-containing protein n=1 Tax=Ferrovibrio sp. TaxID=1917215 RepID=UPI00391BE747